MNPRLPAPRLLVAALAMSLAAAVAADPPASIEARLGALESRWDRMEAEIAAIRALLERQPEVTPVAAPEAVTAIGQSVQALGADLEAVREEVAIQSQALAAASASRQREIAISSYGAINVGKRSGRDSLIDAESFELVLSGQPHPRVSFFSEIEFERAAAVGSARGGEVLLEQAYVDYALGDNLALRGGVVLVPFGNNEADHYAPLREVISRPLSSRLIAPSDWTDNGFGLVGHRELSSDFQLDFEAYLIAGLDSGIDAGGLRNARQGFGEDNNNDKALAAHLSLRRNDQLALGLGVYAGDYDDAGRLSLRGLGLDLGWRLERWRLSGEYLRMRAERAEGGSADLHGGYARAAYDIQPWLPLAWRSSSFPDARLSLVYEYDYVSVEDLTSLASLVERERKHVLGLRYEPDHSWILKLNREWSQASGRALFNGDSDGWLLGIGFVF